MPEVAVQFRVEKTLSFVPEGCVVSYALLADLCGLPGRARMMGKCLREINSNCNWHFYTEKMRQFQFQSLSSISDKKDNQTRKTTR